MNYFTNKIERAAEAKLHTKTMERMWSDEIKHSITETHMYNEPIMDSELNITNKKSSPEVIVTDEDSVRAVFCHATKKTAVLNFASFKQPGGMFLEGSSAQEESLCMESDLYNVLVRFKDSWYVKNATMLNSGLYKDRALYSPDIMFMRNNDITYADVITCACPNKSLIRYGHFSENENSSALAQRIDFVLQIAAKESVDTLILGAFGCGVFSQDANEVANCFKNSLNKYGHHFSKVVFAVPCFSKNDKNHEAFVKVFS